MTQRRTFLSRSFSMSAYEPVIGLEVHVQLKTAAKVFAGVGQGFGSPPNTLTDPVVLALPGALPVLNEAAVHQAIKVGLIFDSEIPARCKWDRKNYFYPDSPKNYQISQFDEPICVGGRVEIELASPSRNLAGEHKFIELTRAHLEEDVGKLTHGDADSLVDYNRAGTPLLEIVTEPVLRSPDEAVALLNSIRMHLVAAGVSDCDMEKGQMRCDANVSVRPAGSDVLNPRAEMKNLNSISGVKNALAYEIRRQTRVYEKGGMGVQETRRWDADAGLTTSMRSKEEAMDYRYFPDPDLLPVEIGAELRESLRAELPERVFDQQRRYEAELGLPYTVTSVICYDAELAEFFAAAMTVYDQNPKALANYIANELQRERAAWEGDGLLPLAEVMLTPTLLAELVRQIDAGKLTKHAAREVFPVLFKEGGDPVAIAQARGLLVETDTGAIEQIIRNAIAANPTPAAEFRAGNKKALNGYMGPIMKAAKGKGDPKTVRDLLVKLVGEG